MKLSRLSVCSCRCCCGGWDQLTDASFIVLLLLLVFVEAGQSIDLNTRTASCFHIWLEPEIFTPNLEKHQRRGWTLITEKPSRVWIFKLGQQKVKQLCRLWSQWVSKHICMFNDICPFFMCRRPELSDVCCFHTSLNHTKGFNPVYIWWLTNRKSKDISQNQPLQIHDVVGFL